MLNLVPFFDLEDVFRKIPEEHLVIPGLFKKYYPNDTLDMKNSSLSLINYDCSGKIYVSFFGFCNV